MNKVGDLAVCETTISLLIGNSASCLMIGTMRFNEGLLSVVVTSNKLVHSSPCSCAKID